jgi:hypothetical protein
VVRARKTIGGLSLVDPKEAIVTLFCREMMTTLEPGEFNLKQFLKYKLERSKPFRHRTWIPNLNWAFEHNHQVAPSSKIWAKFAKTWRKMVKVVNFYPPMSSFMEIWKVGIGGVRILKGDIFACLLQKLPNSINKAYIMWGIVEPQN